MFFFFWGEVGLLKSIIFYLVYLFIIFTFFTRSILFHLRVVHVLETLLPHHQLPPSPTRQWYPWRWPVETITHHVRQVVGYRCITYWFNNGLLDVFVICCGTYNNVIITLWRILVYILCSSICTKKVIFVVFMRRR